LYKATPSEIELTSCLQVYMSETNAVARAVEILRAAGGSLAGSVLCNRLFATNPAFRPVLQRSNSSGGARRFCRRHADVFTVTPPGPGNMTVTLVAGGRGISASRRGGSRQRSEIRAINIATVFYTHLTNHPELQVNDYLELHNVFESWLASECPEEIRTGPGGGQQNFFPVVRALKMTGILHNVGLTVVYGPRPGFEFQPRANAAHEAIAALRRLAADAPPPVQTADEAVQRVNEQRQGFEADKGGIRVGPLVLQPTQTPLSTQTADVIVRNDTDEAVLLLGVMATRERFRRALRCTRALPVSLPPRSETALTITCAPGMVQGVLRTVLAFDFGPEIQIARYVEVVITDPADDALRAQVRKTPSWLRS
jgi:hypothetical protein